jgi:hypothetical protein
MDTTNNRLVQEKPTSTNKNSAPLRRSSSPNDETKINNTKKVRSGGNTDVREWDLPKFQKEKEKSPTERQIIEEQTGNSIYNQMNIIHFNFSQN